LTLRENTERPVTILQGTNLLVGLDPEKIVIAAREALAGRGKTGRLPELWDGCAAERIVKLLLTELPRRWERRVRVIS
jgi:UDP-N-acetylglucosamine 2-epimerase (non-hydrolysing)